MEALPEAAEARLAEVTAVVALMNTTTLRVLAALRRAGRLVPDDVSLVGFDDYSWMQVAEPSITAVRQPVEALGRSAWSRLKERIDGVDDGPLHQSHPTELIVRQSTAALRRRAHPADLPARHRRRREAAGSELLPQRDAAVLEEGC